MKCMSEFYEFGPGPNHLYTFWAPFNRLGDQSVWVSNGKHRGLPTYVGRTYSAAHIMTYGELFL